MKEYKYESESKMGFSLEVRTSLIFKDYATSSCVSGYIGSWNRTKQRDQIVEHFLRLEGLGPDGIAYWLTSTTGRHLMDDVGEKTSNKKFAERTREYTKRAFIDVTIWSHPDHNGCWGGTNRIITALRTALNKADY